MDVIGFLDWLLNHALPVLAPTLTISGCALGLFGAWLMWTDAHARD